MLEPTILDKSPSDSTTIFLFFCHFSVPSLINSGSFWKFSCSSPSPYPIQSWNSKKNSGHASNVVCGGEGRGWTCVNWKTPHQHKSVPRLLSMIVGKWSPPPPRVLSRWRCLAYCWRLGQEVLVFLRLMVRPNSLQVCARSFKHPARKADCGRSAPYWPGVASLEAGGSCPVGHDDPSNRRRQSVQPGPTSIGLSL